MVIVHLKEMTEMKFVNLCGFLKKNLNHLCGHFCLKHIYFVIASISCDRKTKYSILPIEEDEPFTNPAEKEIKHIVKMK